ncbi:MAG TPA: helix-turn-helix transcriptional regulator [Gemmatimonadales bacterium]|nr:helix-turn-helix transcriptional regulator [Gemmatimonadales bacterium]
MDVALIIRRRLDELGLEQRDLAHAAAVTESYVSQLLTRKKAPPAPDRTDIYDRMDRFLKLPPGELARVADAHLKEDLKRRLGDTEPLFPELRELLLDKCLPSQLAQVRAIFERQPFGELERLVGVKLLEVAGLGSDVLHVTAKQHARLESLIGSWRWDAVTFAIEITLTTPGPARRGAPAVRSFEYVERFGGYEEAEPGFLEFLRDPVLSRGTSPDELAFLKGLRFGADRRPTPLYYYRELQNFRDPLHFRAT